MLLLLFSSKKKQILRKYRLLGKSPVPYFSILFSLFFYNYSISLIIDICWLCLFVLFALQYFWKLIYFFEQLKKHSGKCGTRLFCAFSTFFVKSTKKHEKSMKSKLDVFLMQSLLLMRMEPHSLIWEMRGSAMMSTISSGMIGGYPINMMGKTG